MRTRTSLACWIRWIALAAYPITETVYSIYRRKFELRTASMQPAQRSAIFIGLNTG